MGRQAKIPRRVTQSPAFIASTASRACRGELRKPREVGAREFTMRRWSGADDFWEAADRLGKSQPASMMLEAMERRTFALYEIRRRANGQRRTIDRFGCKNATGGPLQERLRPTEIYCRAAA